MMQLRERQARECIFFCKAAQLGRGFQTKVTYMTLFRVYVFRLVFSHRPLFLHLISYSSPGGSYLVSRSFVGVGAGAPFAEDSASTLAGGSVSTGPLAVGFASIVLPRSRPSLPASPGLLASVVVGWRRTSQAADTVPGVQSNPVSVGPSSCRGCQSSGSRSKRGNFLWEGKSDPLELCPVLPFRPCNSSRSPGIASRTNVGLYSS